MPHNANRKHLVASELIAKLEKLLLEHGDKPVTLADTSGVVGGIEAYDDEGGSDGSITEFALHRG